MLGTQLSSSESQITPKIFKFKYHLRILIILVPCWLVLFSMIGRIMVGTVTIFLTLAAFLQSMGASTFSLISAVVGLTIANVFQLLQGTEYFTHSLSFILLLIINSILIAMTGGYISLFYTFLQTKATTKHIPKITEKLLFTILPFLSTPLLTWSMSLQYGMEGAAFWMLLLTCINYILFGIPTQSSYSKMTIYNHESESSSSQSHQHLVCNIAVKDLVCDEMISYTHTFSLFLPLGLYIASYWKSLMFVVPSRVSDWVHLVDVIMLLVLPVLFLGLLGAVFKYSPLWWNPRFSPYVLHPKIGNEDDIVQISRDNSELVKPQFNESIQYSKLLLIGFAALIPCLEYRVVFWSFSHLLNGLDSPWNYIVLTIACYSVCVAVFLHLRQQPKQYNIVSSLGGTDVELSFLDTVRSSYKQLFSNPNRRISYILAVVAAIGFSLVFGLPTMLMPFTILASLAFMSFYFYRQLWMYIIFAIGVHLGLIWFMVKNFGHLSYTFFTLAGFMSVHMVSVLILFLSVISAVNAGLIILDKLSNITPYFLVAQALGLGMLEEVLHMENLEDGEIYPFWLVILTTFCGFAMVRKLLKAGKLNSQWMAILSTIYVAKLALLFKPVAWPFLSALILLLPPFYLVYRLWSSDLLQFNVSSSNLTIFSYTIWMFVACWLNRYTLIQRWLELFAGEPRDNASPVLVTSVAFILFGFSLPPLAWSHPLQVLDPKIGMRVTRRKRFIAFSGFFFISIGFLLMVAHLFGIFNYFNLDHSIVEETNLAWLGSSSLTPLLGLKSGLPLVSVVAFIALCVLIVLVITDTIDYTRSLRQRCMGAMCGGLCVGAIISPFVISVSVNGLHQNPDDSPPMFLILGVMLQFELIAMFLSLVTWVPPSNRISPATNPNVSLNNNSNNLRYAPPPLKLATSIYFATWLCWPFMFLMITIISSNDGYSRTDELVSCSTALIGLQAFGQICIAFVLRLQAATFSKGLVVGKVPRVVADIANSATMSGFLLSIVLNYVLEGSDLAFIALAPILLSFQPYSGTFALMLRNEPLRNIMDFKYDPDLNDNSNPETIKITWFNPYLIPWLAACIGIHIATLAKTWLETPILIIGEILTVISNEIVDDISPADFSSIIVSMIAQLATVPAIVLIAYFMGSWKRIKLSYLLMAILLNLVGCLISNDFGIIILVFWVAWSGIIVLATVYLYDFDSKTQSA